MIYTKIWNDNSIQTFKTEMNHNILQKGPIEGQQVPFLIDALVIATSLNLRLNRQEIRAPRTGSGPTKSFRTGMARATNRLS